jgi:hypothetical protein
MPSARKSLIVVAIIAVAAALLTWGLRVSAPSGAATTPGAADMRTAAASTSNAQDSGAATRMTARWKPDIPDDRPFAEIRPELERRALAGDAAAARRLGMTLVNCNHFVDMSDDKLQDFVVDGAARGFTLKDKGRDMSPEEILARMRLGLEQKRRTCKGVSGLDEPDGWKTAFQWIDRAAALGDPDAEAVYAGLAFADIEDRDALVDAEKMRDRKALAIEYVERSLAAGDALALLQMSGYVGADSGIFPVDLEKSYAYLYAYSLTPRSSEIVPEILQELLSEQAARLDEAAQQRARTEGLRLAACCGGATAEAP